MSLTTAQLATLKSDIAGDQTLNAFPNNDDGNFAIAAIYNIVQSTPFWVWKSSLAELDIVSVTTGDGTVWSWTAFINRSQGERDAWSAMVRGGVINPSLLNVRQAVADIFSGAANSAPAQRTHLLTIARRQATRVEQLFATGTGSTAAPATMAFEGPLAPSDVTMARAS